MGTHIESRSLVAPAFLLAVAIALAGVFIGQGFRQSRVADRYVTVKGLSEKFVRADLAIWFLRFSATSNDLSLAQAKIEEDLAAVTRFLVDAGVPAAEIHPQQLEVVDRRAQSYGQAPTMDNRFTITQMVLVRTENVDLVADLNRRTGELVKRGVILGNTGQPTYVFTRLNDIKPEMIAEATRNARKSAEQFAADANSRIVGIRRANQGVFQILARDAARNVDAANQRDKKVRVVSTIEYLLED